jgi:hypothetical protein
VVARATRDLYSLDGTDAGVVSGSSCASRAERMRLLSGPRLQARDLTETSLLQRTTRNGPPPNVADCCIRDGAVTSPVVA